ncbi:Suppressor of Profilin deletion [Sporothrix eucalyptigena]|uniref:Suppressor of Profilin deletion n=1 Tax=Sporothrix eucalyptigena TaxID=1812306 RepID=A0ABP0AX73_9PEZI
MDAALSRREYPAMLDHLPPGQAVQVLQERVRRIAKVNTDIADFLAERRKIEDQYVAGLKKLAVFRVPNNTAELGVFQPSWDSILRSIDTIANSHRQLSLHIERDVESSLRAFQNKDQMISMNTIGGNLQTMAKELDDAQAQAEKLTKKGGKANAQKVDAATQRLEAATQQWDNQAPFIFETLQELDEHRVNHLRDMLTQLETHEVDQASRSQASAEAMLNLILEIQTADEIQNFASQTIQGRPPINRRANTRQSSIAGSVSGSQAAPAVPPLPQSQSQARESLEPPPTSGSAASQPPSTQQPPKTPTTEAPPTSTALTPRGSVASSLQPPRRSGTGASASETQHTPLPPVPVEKEQKSEKKLRSRLGTLLGRRRQSVHGGFGQLNLNKGPFNRMSVSSHGDSDHNAYSSLSDSNNSNVNRGRLDSLAEDASPTQRDGPTTTNGVGGMPSRTGTASSGGGGVGVVDASTLNSMSVNDIFGVAAPAGPPPSQQQAANSSEPARDAEGYSLPSAANDPISQAQRDAAAASGSEQLGDGDQAFKLNIQNEPVQEEDQQAKLAALSNVSNALQMGMPTRKGGTVRGRRDVRNTIYVPAPASVPESSTASSAPTASAFSTTPLTTNLPSTVSRSSTFGSAATPTKGSALAALAQSESGLGAGTSDTQSVRSATSLSALAHLKHIDTANAGLNMSIIETVSASFADGEPTSVKVAGEIAFSFTAPPGSSKKPSEMDTIRINNFPALEAIGPNRIFVANTDQPDQFTIDTSHLQQKATVGFTFRAHADTATSLAAHCPLVLETSWKPLGDKLGLVVTYRLNPASRLAAAGQPVVLRNVVFIATYEGARSSGVQTKPPGTHLKDKHLVYWRMGEVTLTAATSKIVCRIVGDQGAEPQPGHIEVRWEHLATSSPGLISVSQLQAPTSTIVEEEEQDPFADDTLPSPKTTNGASSVPSWVDVPGALQVVSGKYESK